MQSPFELSDNELLLQAQSLQNSGQPLAAVAIFRSLVTRHPANAQLLYLAGTAEIQAGHDVEAINLLQKSLSLDPEQANAQSNLGVAFWNLRDFDHAEAAYRSAIRLKPDYAEAYSNLSMVLLDGFEKPEDALKMADHAIEILPDYADAHNNRGNALQALARFDEALKAYEQSLLIRPNYAFAHNNRGNALRKLDRLVDAVEAYQEAIHLKPDYAEAYCHMGCTLGELGMVSDARYFFQRALSIDPGFSKAHFNLAAIADKTNNRELALACLDRAIALDPDLLDAYWNKSLLKLLLGDFEEGFRLYEWGWKNKLRGSGRGFKQPLWLGQEPLAGKRLLIHQEQGIGDCIHYARYVQLAVDMGAEVILETVAPLIPLLQSLKAPCTLVAVGNPLPEFDTYIPLMSLPLAFGTTLAKMPPSEPYLFAEPKRITAWSQRLGKHSKPRVGLVWSGSTLHKNDHNRSMPLKDLLPLLSLPLEFHCLQKEIRADDLPCLAALPMINTHDSALNDFADTAALVALMDVVISVDTSVAHVAGAIGKTVWIMLPAAPDWRWLLDREDSPWYPSARLFRQKQPGDWDDVVSQLRKALIDTQDLGEQLS